jgi:threonine dehydratase
MAQERIFFLMLELHDIQAAQKRLNGYVRRTPLVKASPVQHPIKGSGDLYLKLECLQIIGSFKARGAVNKLLSLDAETLKRGIVTASGGNHGLGVAYAGYLGKTSAMIYLPEVTPQIKIQQLAQWGAEVVVKGQDWDEANRGALAAAKQHSMTYIHPFADEAVMAGQGTVGLEVLEDQPEIDTMLISIGGGGLIGGAALAMKALRPSIKIIGIEPVGAPTLYESVRAGYPVSLPAVHTVANTLAPRQSTEMNLDLIRRYVDDIVLITDEDMRDAARWLWNEMNIAAELSGAAALAALLTGKVAAAPDEKVCAIVCGAGTDGIN